MWIKRHSTYITLYPEHTDTDDMLPRIHIPKFIDMTLPEHFTENIVKNPTKHKKLHFHRYYNQTL